MTRYAIDTTFGVHMKKPAREANSVAIADDRVEPCVEMSEKPLPDFGPVPQPRFACIPPPPLRTTAMIADAVEKAIRSIDISERLRIRRIHVEPEYSISDDDRLIAAEVTVKFSLIFPRRADE
jgi:hypothetical protein